MIRHSSSFSISLIIHVVVILLAVLLYNYALSNTPKRVRMNLSKCTIDCGCGCMSDVEKKSKAVMTPKEKPKEQKRVEKKAAKKVETKKAVVKKEVRPVSEKALMSTEVKEVQQIASSEADLEVSQESVAKDEAQQSPQVVSEQEAKESSLEEARRVLEYKKAMQKRYINENLSKIAQMLRDNLYYPTRARRRGIEGDVVVKFTLLKNSHIKDVMIIKHSHDILDSSAVKTIENLQGKLPPPTEELVLEVPIKYRLN